MSLFAQSEQKEARRPEQAVKGQVLARWYLDLDDNMFSKHGGKIIPESPDLDVYGKMKTRRWRLNTSQEIIMLSQNEQGQLILNLVTAGWSQTSNVHTRVYKVKKSAVLNTKSTSTLLARAKQRGESRYLRLFLDCHDIFTERYAGKKSMFAGDNTGSNVFKQILALDKTTWLEDLEYESFKLKYWAFEQADRILNSKLNEDDRAEGKDLNNEITAQDVLESQVQFE